MASVSLAIARSGGGNFSFALEAMFDMLMASQSAERLEDTEAQMQASYHTRKSCRGICLGIFLVVVLWGRGQKVGGEDLHKVRLKNGSVLQGRVLKFDGRDFTIILAGTRSRAIVAVEDVESIDFGEHAEAEPSPPTAKPPEGRRPSEPSASSSQPSPATGVPLQPSGKDAPAPPPGPSAPTGTGSPQQKSQPVAENPAPLPAALPRLRETTMAVLAAEGNWQDSGLDVRKGQRIRISATGRIRISPTQTCGPEGIELKDPAKMMTQHPSGGLIAVIGDDNDDFIFVGRGTEVVTPRSGRLFLMINDSRFEDNAGELTVTIQVEELPAALKRP